MLLQFAFEALEKRKRIRRGPCKPGQNFITEQAARLSRGMFHDVFAHSDLSVGGDHNFVIAAHAQNRGAVYLR